MTRVLRMWRWATDRIGVSGAIFQIVVVTPAAIFMDLGIPSEWVKRLPYALTLWAFGLLMMASKHREDIKKEQSASARAAARDLVSRWRDLPPTQRFVRDEELNVLASGLKEPPA